MFDLISTHWLVHCGLFTLGGTAFGIAFRFLSHDVSPFFFSLIYNAFGLLVVGAVTALFFLSGEPMDFTAKGILFSVVAGISFSLLDLELVMMHRVGGTISVGLPLIRITTALILVVVGIVFFAEHLDAVKLSGIVCCCTGIYLMCRKKKLEEETL